MSTGDKYLAAAYVVVLVAVLAWVAIVSLKLMRLQREIDEAAERPVREGEPGEGVWGNREVPPAGAADPTGDVHDSREIHAHAKGGDRG